MTLCLTASSFFCIFPQVPKRWTALHLCRRFLEASRDTVLLDWVSVCCVSSPDRLMMIRSYLCVKHKNITGLLQLMAKRMFGNVNCYVTLEHKSSHEQHGYICSNSQQCTVWVKTILFYFMTKIIRILRSCSMKIFSKCPTINIFKLNFWLVICIAKNLIWTTLKMIFSIFRFFCTLIFQIFKYCPIITNHTSMEILFIQLSDDV